MIQLTQIRFALFKHHMISVYIWLVYVVNLRDSILIISGQRSVNPVSGRDSSAQTGDRRAPGFNRFHEENVYSVTVVYGLSAPSVPLRTCRSARA